MASSNGPAIALGAKAHVLYSRLLKADEYWALLGLKSTEEIAAFLRITAGYKNQMETMLPQRVHRITLENAVRSSILAEANSFLYYLRGPHRKFFLDWLSWYEAGQVKSIFRWLHSKRLDRDTLRQYLFHVPGSKLPYEAMLACRDYSDMLQTLHGTKYFSVLHEPVRRIVGGEKSHFSLELAIDNMVETNVYNDIMELSPSEREYLRPIFGTRADLTNLYHLHRCLWYYNMSIEETLTRMLPVRYKVTPRHLRLIASAPTWDDRIAVMERFFPAYGKIFREAIGQDDQELALETGLKRFNYNQAFMILRKGSPGFHTAIAYFLLKDHEVGDIIRIIEDVRYDYDRRSAARYLTRPIIDGGGPAWL